MLLKAINQKLFSAIYTLQKLLTLEMNFVHKMKTGYLTMFLYSMFSTLN